MQEVQSESERNRSDGQSEEMQELLKNVDLILLKDDLHIFDIEVRSTDENSDGNSKLLILMNRKLKSKQCLDCKNGKVAES